MLHSLQGATVSGDFHRRDCTMITFAVHEVLQYRPAGSANERSRRSNRARWLACFGMKISKVSAWEFHRPALRPMLSSFAWGPRIKDSPLHDRCPWLSLDSRDRAGGGRPHPYPRCSGHWSDRSGQDTAPGSRNLAFSKYADTFSAACKGKGWKTLVTQSIRLHLKPILANKPLPTITEAPTTQLLVLRSGERLRDMSILSDSWALDQKQVKELSVWHDQE